MKATVVEVYVYEGVLAFAHDEGFWQRRIVIPSEGNFCIWINRNTICISENEEIEFDDRCRLIEEIEIPDSLVEQAKKFLAVKKRFDEEEKQYNEEILPAYAKLLGEPVSTEDPDCMPLEAEKTSTIGDEDKEPKDNWKVRLIRRVIWKLLLLQRWTQEH